VTSNASEIEHAARSAWEPTSVGEVAECLGSAAHDGRALNVSGAGTAQSWGGDSRAAITLRMHKLDSVQRYEPADMTVQVGAGTTVTDLQSVVAEHGQRLALDAARIDRGATIGGIFATADQGPAQLAFGGPRDLVIGATLVLADGQVVRSGGHVIKNVAGYDLARLVSGSLGTLAVITDLTFRLHPLPAATGTLSLETGIGQAVAYAEGIAAAALDPVAAEWVSGRLLVRFEGTPSGVRERLGAAARITSAAGCSILDAAESANAWAQHAAASSTTDRHTGPATTVLRGLIRPTDVFSVVQAANRIARDHEALPTVAAGLLTGRVDVRVAAALLSTHAAVVGQWREVIEGFGGAMTMRERPKGLTGLIDAWGAAPSAVAVLRAVKKAYDPGDLLGRGRFHPWF
jgi:glycolate oxidase FAD binding subunit